MLLFRGRLMFRQYIKNKKSKYGIKFYELTTDDGYILNIEIYQGRDRQEPTPGEASKTEELVLRLLRPYLNKGHHVFMDNFYNSISLSSKLLTYKTHSTGTLRQNRRGNPVLVTKKKLRSGEHVWKKKKGVSIYVSKWKDKRDVYAITTAYQPKMIITRNKYGVEKLKPCEIDAYNKHMSGIDRSDQMMSYYSCPRKTIRWYKKVLFHLLDIAMWNSYSLYCKGVKKIKFTQYRQAVIRSLLQIEEVNDGRTFVHFSGHKKITQEGDRQQHFLEEIPVPEHHKKMHMFLKCKQCTKENRRKETRYRCETCPSKPPLCPAPCYKLWHQK